LNRLAETRRRAGRGTPVVFEECRERLVGWDEYVAAMRDALRSDTSTARPAV
jgi:hypothetical protein